MIGGVYRQRHRRSQLYQLRRLARFVPGKPAPVPFSLAADMAGGVNDWTSGPEDSTGTARDHWAIAQPGFGAYGPDTWALHCTIDADAGAANAFARGIFNIASYNVGLGAELWYGVALYLIPGTLANIADVGGVLDVLRVDNFTTKAGVNVDHAGLTFFGSDEKLRLFRDGGGGSLASLITGITVTEGAWHWIEVHQVFGTTSGGSTLNELYLDGSLVGSNTTQNVNSDPIRWDYCRAGVVAIGGGSQTAALELWVDRARVNNTGLVGPLAGGTTAPAEAASGAGAAPDATAAVGANAEAASGAGSALDATVSLGALAEPASATGTANAASADITAGAETAAGTGTAPDVTPALAVAAEAASAAGSALDATVSTVTAADAPAEAAAGTGTALDAAVALGANAEVATAAGSALDASVALTAAAEAASATGTAADATGGLGALAETATATGLALDGIQEGVPDAILANSNLGGVVTELWDDPTDPDTAFLDATDPSAATDLRVSFPTPATAPGSGGPRTFRVYVRRTGGAGTDPTVIVDLWEAGAFVRQLASATVTSTVGQLVTGTLDPADLTTASGADVQLRVRGIPV